MKTYKIRLERRRPGRKYRDRSERSDRSLPTSMWIFDHDYTRSDDEINYRMFLHCVPTGFIMDHEVRAVMFILAQHDCEVTFAIPVDITTGRPCKIDSKADPRVYTSTNIDKWLE